MKSTYPSVLSPNKIPNLPIITPENSPFGVTVFVKRLDLVHPLVSGNKFFKLKYNLQHARKKGHDTLLTFGGAYSNHIYATSAATKSDNFKAIGIIRGEATTELNPTLSFAKKNGMLLSYMDRKQYRQKHTTEVINMLHKEFGDFYLIPEGGTNQLAIKGAMEILTEEDQEMDYICSSIGTGGTISGLIGSALSHQKVLGFSSLKGRFIIQEVEQLLRKYHIRPSCGWEIFTNYHFGGYAKHHPDLIDFIKNFNKKFQIPLDPIYTGKLFYGAMDLLKNNYFPEGSKVLLIHSGGLQGVEGFNLRHHENI